MHCTGSILTRKLILSAGHCFAENSDNYVPKEELKIVFGVHDLAMLDIPNIQWTIRNIKSVRFHRNYQSPKAYSGMHIRITMFRFMKYSGVLNKRVVLIRVLDRRILEIN